MATWIANGTPGTTSASLPPGTAVDDYVVVTAYKATATAPTLPANWTLITSTATLPAHLVAARKYDGVWTMPVFTGAARCDSVTIRPSVNTAIKAGAVLSEAKNVIDVTWSALSLQVTDGSSVILRGVSHTRNDVAFPLPANHTLISQTGVQPGYGTWRRNDSLSCPSVTITVSRATTYTVFSTEFREVPAPNKGSASASNSWTIAATGETTGIFLAGVGAKTSGDAGTTSLSISRPTLGNDADNITFSARTIKPSTATGSTPSGWFNIAAGVGGTGASTVDEGATGIVLDYQRLVGGESGAVNFAQGNSPDSVTGCMVTYQRTTGRDLDVIVSIANDTTHGTGRSALASNSIPTKIGDVLLAFVALDTDSTTPFTAPTISNNWHTIVTTELVGTGGSSEGNNTGLAIYEGLVTAGSANSIAPTLTLTEGPSNCGPVVFVRLREIDPPQVIQAAYGWYDEGTQAAAPTLAAQDTPISLTKDGTTTVQLRTRIQNRKSLAVPNYEYKLQYEKNGSNVWTDVSSDVLVRYDPSMAAIQSYYCGDTAAYHTFGQAFKGNGQKLTKILWMVSSNAAAVEDTTVQIFAHTGVYGVNGLPTGPALATSAPVSAATMTSAATPTAYCEYVFDGSFVLEKDTSYFAMFQSAGIATGIVYVGLCNFGLGGLRVPPGIGNTAIDLGGFLAATGNAAAFTICTTVRPTAVSGFDSPNLTEYSATTRRLTVGTGTFVAGKAGEKGFSLATITGLNYTENLNPIAIDTTRFSGGDSLRFRSSLRGQVVPLGGDLSSWLTYNQYPTINIVGGLAPNFGEADFNYEWKTTAVGYVARFGTASIDNTWVPTASGFTPSTGDKQGRITASWDASTTAIGKRDPLATVTAIYSYSSYVFAYRPGKGNAAITFSYNVNGTGSRSPKASSSANHTWTLIAQGVKPLPGQKQGTSLATWAETISAVGTRTPKATATATYLEIVTVNGTKFLRGTATATWNEVISVVGKKPLRGSATVLWSESVTTSGKRVAKANSVVFHSWDALASGKHESIAIAILDILWKIAAIGVGTRGITILNEADSVYLGSTQVKAVYVGNQKVWEV